MKNDKCRGSCWNVFLSVFHYEDSYVGCENHEMFIPNLFIPKYDKS